MTDVQIHLVSGLLVLSLLCHAVEMRFLYRIRRRLRRRLP